MEREIDLKEISDGKLYTSSDMVKAGCDDCRGCSACCQGMGESILLDPLDIYRLTTNLECTFEELLGTCAELHVVDGIILPNMKMVGKAERCAFLNEEGRCNIHAIRPGICRLFPLGRCYEDGDFRYFLQIHECKKEQKTKVKIKKWLDTPDLKQYEEFTNLWHYFQKDVQKILKEMNNEIMAKKINVFLLELFYQKPYDKKTGFYDQFAQRLAEGKRFVGIAG
ncbi:MAG: YkgJ family cysteine cluster protein [Clostridiales bacterium]|nr:YkgJ family cysteine cluster protein [Clostridiales bacterium]